VQAGPKFFEDASWDCHVGSALNRLCKVETPIHDSIKGIDNLGVQRAWSKHHECVSTSERKCWALVSEFLEA
jgi:hypothetical protein